MPGTSNTRSRGAETCERCRLQHFQWRTGIARQRQLRRSSIRCHGTCSTVEKTYGLLLLLVKRSLRERWDRPAIFNAFLNDSRIATHHFSSGGWERYAQRRAASMETTKHNRDGLTSPNAHQYQSVVLNPIVNKCFRRLGVSWRVWIGVIKQTLN